MLPIKGTGRSTSQPAGLIGRPSDVVQWECAPIEPHRKTAKRKAERRLFDGPHSRFACLSKRAKKRRW
jgi:hypothetical protein